MQLFQKGVLWPFDTKALLQDLGSRRCPLQAAVGEIYAVLCLQTKVPGASQVL